MTNFDAQKCAEAARAEVRRYRNRSVIGFLVLLLGVGFAVRSNSHTAHEAQAAAREAVSTKTLLASNANECARVNILRAQSNISNDVSFVILSSAAKRELALAKADRPDRAVHAQSAHAFIQNAERLKVTALTDCDHAVNRPVGFSFPLAGPIGDPRTGKQAPGVKEILRASDALVSAHSHGTQRGG
jgi:hypothetical protein